MFHGPLSSSQLFRALFCQCHGFHPISSAKTQESNTFFLNCLSMSELFSIWANFPKLMFIQSIILIFFPDANSMPILVDDLQCFIFHLNSIHFNSHIFVLLKFSGKPIFDASFSCSNIDSDSFISLNYDPSIFMTTFTQFSSLKTSSFGNFIWIIAKYNECQFLHCQLLKILHIVRYQMLSDQILNVLEYFLLSFLRSSGCFVCGR